MPKSFHLCKNLGTIRKIFQIEFMMKKLIALMLPMALALTACVTPDGAPTAGTSLAMSAAKIGVQAKCVNEISNNSTWKTGSRLLSDAKKQEVQTEVCSCVADKATTTVGVADLAVAAMDKTSQANIITKVVATSLNACVVQTLQSNSLIK